MRNKTCIVCGRETKHPIRAAFEHFYLWNPGMLQYLSGNIKAFGFWYGLTATICLVCPAFNTVKNWKYRKHDIEIPKVSRTK